jgi:secreted trypsin-like serine protease
MKCLALLFFVLGFSSVYAGTIDPSVSDDKYIKYGKDYECVLPIMGILNDNLNSNFRGSCIVIDRYHILTAAHVVQDSITQHVLYENKAYPCLIVAIHAKFDMTKKASHDIAIARLQRAIDLDFYPSLYEDNDETGKVCGMAGYGFHGNFKTGYLMSNYDNKKRAGSNIIDGIEGDVLTYSIGQQNKTSLEFLISPGDSGGGLFIDQKLAGIHSFIYSMKGKADGKYGNVGCSTRVSDYIDWINKTKKIIKKVIGEQDEKKRM